MKGERIFCNGQTGEQEVFLLREGVGFGRWGVIEFGATDRPFYADTDDGYREALADYERRVARRTREE